MKIAVTYENGQVFQHFGHCKLFCLADTETGSRELIDPMGEGHGARLASCRRTASTR
mgnify:CR=1 FL=1